VPILDLATPDATALRSAARAIEHARTSGSVLVSCALGYSRSAAAAATWLLMSGRAASAHDAIAALRNVRPHLRLDDLAVQAITRAARNA
jgi:protein-tyrosine phosphatase